MNSDEMNDDALDIKSVQVLTSMATEYKRLALLSELDEASSERMSAILELASVDKELNKLITQVDIEVASELEEG